MMNDRIGLQVRASAGPGVLHQLTGAIAQLRGDISSVEISSQGPTEDLVNFEIDLPGSVDQLVQALQDLTVVRGVEVVDTLKTIYGKRIIIMGGGAQVGQVAIGAISEADRHNIRGERISVDTIPLVGEQQLADAVRAVARLPREAYEWYLDLRRYGTFTHSGFGLGLERTVAWICGIPHVREVIAFPRLMHRLKP